MAEPVTVVLVHGAWHGAWCWDEVAERLTADGTPVVAVDSPSVAAGGDMYDDARNVREAIAAAGGETVVVGHSYGGVVITEAAAGAQGVRHLLYLTAFMLDAGESLATITGSTPPALADRRARRAHDDGGRPAAGLLQHVRARRSPTRPPPACARRPSPRSCSR